jgi:hypothetical protein
MALPINVFRSVTAVLTDTLDVVYTAPANNTAIVLMAQVANVDSSEHAVTFVLVENPGGTETELVKEFSIPSNDAASVVTGKLIVESGNQLKAQSSTSGELKLTLSILESRNA